MPIANFLIIGAAKAATTSLASLLMQHPDAIIARGKEPHFFAFPQLYRQGLGQYETLFSHHDGAKALGDASTSYSRIRQHPKVIERIRKDLRKPKIIYMVRHPIERIESAYVEQMTNPQNKGIESINEAIKRLPMMVDSSRYWETYSAYSKTFGAEAIQVIWFEDFVADPMEEFSRVCDFLEIDSTFKPDMDAANDNSRDKAINRVAKGEKLDANWNPAVLQQVVDTLQPDTSQFLQHFGKPVDYWSF